MDEQVKDTGSHEKVQGSRAQVERQQPENLDGSRKSQILELILRRRRVAGKRDDDRVKARMGWTTE
jgi:hypothetical protein